MPRLTPLHENYCRFDRTPPSQADFLEGIAQLLTSNLLALEDVLPFIQMEMLVNTFGLKPKQAKRLTARPLLQKIVGQSMQLIQNGNQNIIAPMLRRLNVRFPNLKQQPLYPVQHFLVGLLNGVMGSTLIQQQNPLAVPMVLYDHYGSLQQGDLTGRVVILVHGLCMSHLSWSSGGYMVIGDKLLAQRDNNTMLYLNYNTGRRISANGKTFARILDDLVQQNPGITGIDLIGHSMGGLVCRSALFYGKQNLYPWVDKVQNLVCIGSPHHGAALERLSFMLQDWLGRLPILKLIGRLGEIRSDGILDLRYGSVRDDDWEYLDNRIGNKDDQRKPAPIPSKINCFLIAGSIELSPNQSKTLEKIGDYLVSVSSALGEHPNPKLQLNVPDSHKAIFYGLNHREIQVDPTIAEQIVRWLYPQGSERRQQQIQTVAQQAHPHFHHRQMYNFDDL